MTSILTGGFILLLLGSPRGQTVQARQHEQRQQQGGEQATHNDCGQRPLHIRSDAGCARGRHHAQQGYQMASKAIQFQDQMLQIANQVKR